jgi:hypothetical protein
MHVVACRYDRPALEALLAREVDVTLVVDAWESENRPLTQELLERVAGFHVVGSFDDMVAMSHLAVRLMEGPRVDKVLSLAEYGQLGAAYLARMLGLESPSIPLSAMVRDKRAMKRVAREAGLPCARITLVEQGSAGQAMDAVGYPAVLKPASGMGTVDTWMITNQADLEGCLAKTGGQVMIAEEYITGNEYHVDAVWRAGQAVALGVGRYPVPRLQISTPGRQNGSALLSRSGHRAEYAALEALSIEVNRAFGIDTGITHAEFFHTPDGRWLFSEIATRPGGGAIPEMFRHTGMELRELWMRVETDPDFTPQLQDAPAPFVGWVNIAPPRTGLVVDGPTEEQCRAFNYVTGVIPGHRAGDRIAVLHPSIWSWMVQYAAQTWDEFLARGAELESALVFTMEVEHSE